MLRRRHGPPVSVLIDTTTVESRERAERWARAHERLFFPVGVEFASGDSSCGRIEGRNFGSIGAYRVWSDASVVSRDGRAISVDDPERFLVALPLTGTCTVAQGGRSTPFAAGEMSSWESSHPFEVKHHEQFELLLVVLPTSLLGGRRDAITGRTASRIPASSGVGLVAASMFRQLWELRDEFAVDGTDEDIAEAILSFVRAIHRDGDQVPVAPQLPGQVLRRQIKEYVISHLGNVNLRPESIARAHYISTRYLHKLFEDEGMTVSGWIRHRRLEACRRDLRDPAFAADPISEVARRWALADPAHFSRMFREAYGCTPSEFRRSGPSA